MVRHTTSPAPQSPEVEENNKEGEEKVRVPVCDSEAELRMYVPPSNKERIYFVTNTFDPSGKRVYAYARSKQQLVGKAGVKLGLVATLVGKTPNMDEIGSQLRSMTPEQLTELAKRLPPDVANMVKGLNAGHQVIVKK